MTISMVCWRNGTERGNGSTRRQTIFSTVTPPTTQPPWADLELNSGLRGERLTFSFYILSDCCARRTVYGATGASRQVRTNFSLHLSSRTAFCALLASHAAPPSPLTATPSSHNSICVSDNWPCHSEDGYGPVAHF
jgi:hypothetical protein